MRKGRGTKRKGREYVGLGETLRKGGGEDGQRGKKWKGRRVGKGGKKKT